jgi:hypothetical protein
MLCAPKNALREGGGRHKMAVLSSCPLVQVCPSLLPLVKPTSSLFFFTVSPPHAFPLRPGSFTIFFQ